ncbi:hypothetical protein CP533_4879 [Ophiocordyceps camponoti-saundersi (nom. inval.)]|nr:hypothetical protein CP533_4879 [Ophiocordyceps camponoti-saundersi (nom. inval.)]
MTGLRRTARAEDATSRTRNAWSLTGNDRSRQAAVWKLEKRRKKDEEKRDRPPSRRKRFLDPNDSFGKKSFVFQAKQSGLLDQFDLYDRSNRFAKPRQAEQLGWPDRLDDFQRSDPQPQRSEGLGQGDRLGRLNQFDQSQRPDHQPQQSQWSGQAGRMDRFNQPRRPERIDGNDQPQRSARFEQPDRSDQDDQSRQSQPRYYTERRFPQIKPHLIRQADRGYGALTEVKYTAPGSIFIYGKNCVKAALRAGKRQFYTLYMMLDRKEGMTTEETVIYRMAAGRGVSIVKVEDFKRGMLDKMSGGRPHNGYVLETSPLPQKPILGLCEVEESADRLGFYVKMDHQSKEQERVNGKDNFIPRMDGISPKPFILVLHNVVDPGNLGALVRTAHFLGVDAIAITRTHSATFDSVALKAAAGSAEEVTLFSISSAVDFVEQSKAFGWRSYAAVPPPSRATLSRGVDPPLTADEIERTDPLIRDPCILVLGNEGHGIGHALKDAVHHHVTIPGWRPYRTVDSLNVSVAGALMCQSFLKASHASEGMVEAAANRWKKTHAKPQQSPIRPEPPLQPQTGDFGCRFLARRRHNANHLSRFLIQQREEKRRNIEYKYCFRKEGPGAKPAPTSDADS